MLQEPSFTMGIEEEYLLVHTDTLELADAPQVLMDDCVAALGGQVSPEFLRCQVEVGTGVCATIAEAREDLKRLRAGVAACAAKYGMAPIAASCHPTADWKDQHHTDKDRYNALKADLAGVGRRMLISGMHVHVGIEQADLRIDLMNQASYFLPHLLALSCSSPYWQGEDTGLASYRLTVFDNLPRTGLPPRFDSYAEFRRSVDALVSTGVIEDATKIWWDQRPSDRFPTLEARICDVSPRLEHTLAIAALTQCLMRMLYRLRARNLRWRLYDPFLVGENRWRAQRHGMSKGLIDFGRSEIVPFAELLDEMISLVEEDAAALGSSAEMATLRDLAAMGNSAERQRNVAKGALGTGQSQADAMRAVTQSLVDEFTMDL